VCEPHIKQKHQEEVEEEVGKTGPVQAVEFPSEYLPDTHATGDELEDAQLEPAGQSAAKRRKNEKYR
jgi:hypothetical protein